MDVVSQGSYYAVTARTADVIALAGAWPCHGLDLDAEYFFEFDGVNGDLVDLWKEVDGIRMETGEDDGPALSALSEEAGRFGALHLELSEVISLRYVDGPKP